MKRTSIFSIITKYWRELAILFCLSVGTGLIFSMQHLLPVFGTIFAENNQENEKKVHQPFAIPLDSPFGGPDYINFLPILFSGEKQVKKPEKEKLQEQALPEPQPEKQPSLFDFKYDSQPVTIVIEPEMKFDHAGKNVEISFLPGNHCAFGEGYGCVYKFLTPNEKHVTFVSVHSGLGGEGDDLRNLLEGTGINQGLFKPDQVLNVAKSLIGSEIRIEQGDRKISDLTLSRVIRIPPEYVETYTALPVEDTLEYAVKVASLDRTILNDNLMVIETCGWRLPGEEEIAGLNDMSYSVYLVIVSLENFEIVKN